MPPDDLDLSGKKESAEEKPKGRGGAGPQAVYTRPDRGERQWEKEVRGRIERTQERLIEWLEGRGDDELATVFKEDGPAMIGGLIAAMRPAMWLRAPVILVLTIVEPLLAFGRLFRVLLSRLGRVREARAEEWERQEQERLDEEAKQAEAAGGA